MSNSEALVYHSEPRPGKIEVVPTKPVMERKAVLVKKFAGIDVFDLEIDCANSATFP